MLHNPKRSPEVLDLLATNPSTVPFMDRVKALNLSQNLEKKVLLQEGRLPVQSESQKSHPTVLTIAEEKELATEMLLIRHRFTELIVRSKRFRQAALTIVQNIYLFQNRRIFFGTTSTTSSERERQEALQLFSTAPTRRSIPFAKTIQHLILARVWNRIFSSSTDTELQSQDFITLHDLVEKLNTIRNIYVLLTTGLVRKLASRISDIYKESVTIDDAVQIGSFGIARAAYRYHQSTGVRFSTFAANWVFKEIQRQALQGRLIKLSANAIEQYSCAAKSGNASKANLFKRKIDHATTDDEIVDQRIAPSIFPMESYTQLLLTQRLELQELHAMLLHVIDEQLSVKAADVIKRRYGLHPYQGKEQSIISISKEYSVTRGSIYQLEQAALKKLHRHLDPELL